MQVARNRNLDVLRCVAVLMTFGRHMAEPLKDDLPGYLYKPFYLWFKAGWTGVSLFFVLSGFLVSSLMFNEFLNVGEIRFSRFYIRRGLKIYPAFYCLLLASLLGSWAFNTYLHRELFPTEKFAWPIILSEALFVQNYCGFIWVHVWSLAVEEHFYILLGIVVWLVMRYYPKFHRDVALRDRFLTIPWICATAFVVCLGLRCFFLFSAERSIDARFNGGFYTHHRIDSLFFGVWIAYFVKFRPESFLVWVKSKTFNLPNTLWLFLAGLALISPAAIYQVYETQMMSAGYTFLHVGFGGILLFTLYHPWKAVTGWLDKFFDLLSYLGQNSYSIYLWHVPVMHITLMYLPDYAKNQLHLTPMKAYLLLVAVQCVAGTLVGLVMAKLIEMPILQLRDHFFATPKTKSAVVEA